MTLSACHLQWGTFERLAPPKPLFPGFPSNQSHAILVGEILRRRSANLHNARAHANSTCSFVLLHSC
ncbi:hypothetical protein V8C40DRAFT_91993 [Trichoderma camerunense]